jgi:hypothetical protein
MSQDKRSCATMANEKMSHAGPGCMFYLCLMGLYAGVPQSGRNLQKMASDNQSQCRLMLQESKQAVCTNDTLQELDRAVTVTTHVALHSAVGVKNLQPKPRSISVIFVTTSRLPDPGCVTATRFCSITHAVKALKPC